MKDDFYDDIPLNDEYIPKHASNNEINNYHNWNNEFLKDVSSNNQDTSNVMLDKDNKIEVIKKELPQKKKKKNFIWIILISVFIIAIIICVIKIISWIKDNKATSDIVNEIEEITEVTLKEDDDNTELINEEEDEESDYWYYIKFPLIDVDITKLKDINSDTVGFINVNNTNINYPYVLGKDNDYYLTHSFDKSYNEAGWVFLDYRNNKDLTDKNNILYAHSRLDKTMFGSLSKTLKSNWYSNKDNHIIRLSTENENTLWQIFSVYKIPEESYYITTNFATDSDYEKFLTTIKGRSIYDFNANLSSSDKILTLSTCYSDTERTVVHAKLIKRSSN